MITLSNISSRLQHPKVLGSTDIQIKGVAFDSRKVAPGFLFVAVFGTNTDGHLYIKQAIADGAVALIVQEAQSDIPSEIACIQVENSAQALAIAASEFYGNPSAKLKLVGVTGTNGKTTIASLLFNTVQALGHKAGLVSTVDYRIHNKVYPSTHTTPDSLHLNKMLAEMVAEGCQYAFMEVSSHAAAQHRVFALQFAGGIFTNLTHDHLDYHKTFKEYLYAKKSFFDQLPKGAFALANADDKNGMVMMQNTKATKKTFGVRVPADFSARILEMDFNGMLLTLQQTECWVRFIGSFNASNLAAVVGTLSLLGFDKQTSLQTISAMMPVDGRFEPIAGKSGVTAIIDYAHTPDALENVLKTIREIDKTAKLISLVAAGGDRDKSKRPKMAQIARQYADRLILTSDNPRTEDPMTIIADMQAGLSDEQLKTTLVIADRREAIKTACMLAESGSIILIPGKGHETYQDIMNVKYPFNDKEIVAEFI